MPGESGAEQVSTSSQGLPAGISLGPADPAVLGTIPSMPPAWLLWITVVVALGTLAWRFYIFTRSEQYRRSDINRSIVEQYWFRTIILPICVEPLREFIPKHVDRLSELDGIWHSQPIGGPKRRAYDAFLKLFQKEKELLIYRFHVLSALTVPGYEDIQNRLDDLDDAVTEHCYAQSVNNAVLSQPQFTEFTVTAQEFYVTLADTLRTLASSHRRTFSPDEME